MNARAPMALKLTGTVPPPSCAMVMAAGLGKRMRPLTATRPKPLVELAGKAMIDHVLDRLADAGVGHAVVNVHYLADALEAHLARRARAGMGPATVISDERAQLLETGGGLVKALPLIDADPFLCINSDNYWVDGPLSAFDQLAMRWDPAAMDVLLLLVPLARAEGHGGRGDFHMDALGRICRRRPGRVAPFVFTGIQMMSRRLITAPPADVFSTNVFLDRAIAEGRAWGVVHLGQWFDVGTPQAIGLVEARLAQG